jgi:hypothetical protein
LQHGNVTKPSLHIELDTLFQARRASRKSSALIVAASSTVLLDSAPDGGGYYGVFGVCAC